LPVDLFGRRGHPTAQDVTVTFSVDMTAVDPLGDPVSICGGTAPLTWTPGDNPLTDPEPDLMYTIDLLFPAGTDSVVEYKYVNGDQWESIANRTFTIDDSNPTQTLPIDVFDTPPAFKRMPASKILIARGTSMAAMEVIAELDPAVASWTDASVPENGTQYYYAISVESDGEQSPWQFTGPVSSQPNVPAILLAGWLGSSPSASGGGALSLYAMAAPATEDGAEVSGVEIYYEGVATGAFLPDLGNGLYGMDLAIDPCVLAPMELKFGLAAVNADGAVSDLWPDLFLLGAGGAAKRAWRAPSWWHSIGLPADPDAPVVYAAGYGPTVIVNGFATQVVFQAVVTDPQGDLASVQLALNKTQIGIELRDDGLNGDAMAGDMIFTFVLELLPEHTADLDNTVLPFEIVATDVMGHTSDFWPYLLIRE